MLRTQSFSCCLISLRSLEGRWSAASVVYTCDITFMKSLKSLKAIAHIAHRLSLLIVVCTLPDLLSGCGGCSTSEPPSALPASTRQPGNSPGVNADPIAAAIEAMPRDSKSYVFRDSYALGDKHLILLARLTHLEEIDLSGCPAVSDEAVAKLAHGRRLRVLALGRTGAGAKTLEELSACDSLVRLELTLCDSVADDDIAKLHKCVQLQELNLYGCSALTDRSLATLARFSALTKLDISYCSRLTDLALAEYVNKSKLQYLVAGHTTLSSRFADALTSNSLQTLDIRSTPDIAESSVARLKARLPSLKVVRSE